MRKCIRRIDWQEAKEGGKRLLFQISFSVDGEQVQVMKYSSNQENLLLVLEEFFKEHVKIDPGSLKGIGIVGIGG